MPVRKRKTVEPEVQDMFRVGDDPGLRELQRNGVRSVDAEGVQPVRGERRGESPEAAPQCQVCGDVGFTFTVDAGGNRFAVDCGCRAERRMERQIKATGLPPIYTRESLDTYAPTHETQQLAAVKARHYINQWPMHDGRGLCFIGPPGTGKTHLAVAILRELVLSRGAQALFVSEGQMYKQMQRTYGGKDETEDDVLRPIVMAEALVIDELGARRPTEWATDQMEYVIGERYQAGRPTIITSNLRLRPAPRAVEEGEVALYRQAITSETLAERLGMRVASRLQAMCEMVAVEGADYRTRKRQA